MNVTTIKKLPPIEDLIRKLPLSEDSIAKIARDTLEIKNILEGKDQRLLVIVGPCSAWPREAVFEYAKKLKILESKLSDNLKIVMRVYIQKPRTIKGWTGPISQPDPFSNPDIEAGMHYCRGMMIKVIELGLPIADELLFTHNTRGFLELTSYNVIGARSIEDQEHRIFASAINCPVGMKNPTSGLIKIAINGIVVAQHSHTALFHDTEVKTHGNPHAHLILRGGEKGANYSLLHIEEAYKYMLDNDIKNPTIIIDASHDNSKLNGEKNFKQQVVVVHEVIKSMIDKPELRKIVKGFQIESFIREGNQKIDPENPENIDLTGLSITDPCLGWEETEELLLELGETQKKYEVH